MSGKTRPRAIPVAHRDVAEPHGLGQTPTSAVDGGGKAIDPPPELRRWDARRERRGPGGADRQGRRECRAYDAVTMRGRLRMREIVVSAALIATGGVASACGQSPQRTTQPAQRTVAPSRLVAPAAFARAIRRPGTVTINVHVPFAGRIAWTDLSVPYNRIAQEGSRLPGLDARLALYCRSGRMSAIAARTLASMGYRHIVELRGGMEAWSRSGRRLQTRR